MSNIEHTTHLVAFMLLLARIGDVGSTYLATPKLKLESNPVVRRFKWPFAVLTIFVAVLPYYSLGLGICLLVVSLLVCASNFSKLWLIRTLGEDEHHQLLMRLASRSNLGSSMLFIFAPALWMAALGFLVLHFYPDPNRDWGYYFALGFFVYALAIGLWGSVAFLRYRKEGFAECGGTP